MKVAHAEAHVLSSQGLEEKQVFKIRTNAHAFRLLSSGLYSDKIAAVIREIGCNAHDAHISAGKAHLPIEVKLPNNIDNQFYIRDFGPGLSHEEVMNLYTTYFASTKQESNDFTGAFGLGSKSPFSYTDSFTITSRHGGVNRVYSAHIGNDGAPNIAKMGESPCGDDTGIEISFPVSPNDFSDFRHRAQQVYQYFNPLPKIIGSEAIKPLDVQRDFTEYAFISHEQGVKVKMGNVCYPVDTGKLSIMGSDRSDNMLANNMSNLKGVLLRFSIGDVQVAASREELQYDDAGKAFIKAALKKVIYNMCHEIEKLWNDTFTEDTLAKRIEFSKLSEASQRGFWFTAELLQEAGCKKPEKLYEALKQRYEKLPGPAAHSTYDYVTQGRARLSYDKAGSHIYYGHDLKVPTIVYGCEPHARQRVRESLAAGTLELPLLLVVPIKSDKGTIVDVQATIDILTRQMGKLEQIKLSDLAAPNIPKKPKLKKGQLPPLPAELLAIQPPVYVNQQSMSNWGNNKTFWSLNDADPTVSNSNILLFDSCIEKLENIMVIPPFARLTKMQMIRHRILKRTDWVDLKTYMTKVLADPVNIDALKAAVGNFKFKLELCTWRQDSADGLLENLVHIAYQKHDVYQTLGPVLEKYKLKDQIDEVLKNSKTNSGQKPIELVQAYKTLADILNIEIDVPEFDAPTVEINKKFPAAARLPYRTYIDLWTHARDRLPDVLDQLLKKG